MKRWSALSIEERISRWRLISIGNSVAALVIAISAFIFLRFPWSLVVAGVVVIGAADTWYLAGRLRETGNPFTRPRSR